MTLMLHRPNETFDSLAFLADFIALLQEKEMRVVTYRDLSENPELTATQQGKLFIITIDDIYLHYPIASGVLKMIDLLKEAGYPAVLGVITEGDDPYPQTVATLKELSDLGWEIASHTDTHRNLLEVQKISPKAIYPEIKTSLDKIEAAIGLRPITLVLPLGQMTNGDEQIKRSEVQWVVGINGGVEYDMTAAYYYVGREGPDGNAQETYDLMEKRFGK
jgi:peptidoglycan/xylan/chitin deacetylase (PgdA/CDA1 family)